MNPEIIQEGRKLVRALERKSEEFHVKSDQHDILGYEAAILAARLDFIENKKEIQDNLKDSTLLSPWAEGYSSNEWKVLQDTVRTFYAKIRMEPETEPDGAGQPH